MASWKKGECGNIHGSPLGTGVVARMRTQLAEAVPEIIATLAAAAKAGDTAAAKLIIERVVPSLRPEELPVALVGFSGSRTELIAAVVQAIADGKLDLSRGGAFHCRTESVGYR